MTRATAHCLAATFLLVAFAADALAQKLPYDVFPPADPPYFRVRYEASTAPGTLPYGVNYTVWVPPGVKTLRGVVVHQHGCGEGSCKSGLTGAYDLHWQALAKKHGCALLSPAYEQPEKADCQMWCDPRNGSDTAFQKGLADLGKKSGHPELATVPWALWGHSGGGHWAGGMVMLHPDRVAAAWLRSGVPMLSADPSRTAIKAHTLPDAALKVPLMCNLGTKEGVTVKDKNFGGVWPANETFFNAVRGKGGLVAVAIDPLSSHDCGNQRYLAIPWLDACLDARLPKAPGEPMTAMRTDKAWLALPTGTEAFEAAKFTGDPLKAGWLPDEATAKRWAEYVADTKVTDATPPPAPTNVKLDGAVLTWDTEADLESGLAAFVIERDGKALTTVPEQGKNPFGRPLFQNLQYSDTPTQPLVPMRWTDAKPESGQKHAYRVIAVNTVGLKSKPSADAVVLAMWPPEKTKSSEFTGRKLDTFSHNVRPEWGYAAPQRDTFLVLHPKEAKANAPLYVVLHSAGHDVNSCLACTTTVGNHDIYHAPPDFFALYLDCRANKGDWWWGSEKYKGPDVCPTEKRVIDTVNWVVKEYGLDKNRVYLCGNSMGGSGTLGIGVRHGDVFAAVKANVPAKTEHVASRMYFGQTPPAGVTFPDPPIVVDYSAPNDGWSKGHEAFAAAMNDRKYPLFLYWGPFGHANNHAAILKVNDLINSFDWLSVKKNEAYPVFSNASTNDPLPWPNNLGEKKPGQVNAFFRWSEVRDTGDGVEAKLFLTKASDLKTSFAVPTEATADVTLRRVQKLRLAPGATAYWTFGRASGEVKADAQGIVTVPGLKITTESTTLTVRTAKQ